MHLCVLFIFHLILYTEACIPMQPTEPGIPSTTAPVTEEPVTDEPVTEEPVTDEPVTEEPVTDQPITDEPITDAPEKLCEEVKDLSPDINEEHGAGSAGPPTMTDSITCPDPAFPVLYFIPDATNWEPLEITNVICDATTKQWQGTVNGVTGPLAPKYTAPFHFACSTKDTGPIESVCEGVKDLSAALNAGSPGSAGPPTMTDSITCPDAAFPVLYFIPDPTNLEQLEITNVMCDATTKQWQGTVNGVTGPLAPKYTAPFHFACSTKDTGPIESVCEGVKNLSADINVDSPGSAGPPTMTDSITCPDAAFPVLYFIPDPTNREPLEITNVMCDATTKQWQGTVNGVTGPLAPKYTAPFHFACSTKDTGPIESVCEGVKNLSADINVDSPGSAGPPTMTDSITCPDAAFPVLYFIPDPTNREPLEITNVMCDATTKQWQGTVNGVTGPLAPKYTAPFHFACSTKDTGPIESVCEGVKDLSAALNAGSPGSAGPPTMTDSITCPDAAFPVLYFIPDPTNLEQLEITNVMCDATTKQWQGTVNGVTGPLAPKYTAPFHFACSTKDTGPIESVCEGVKNLSADINVDSPGSAGPPTMTDSITCPDAAFPVLYFIPDPTNREPLEITNVMCDATTKQWQGTVNGVTGPLAPKYTAPFHFACSTKDTGPIESVCEGVKNLSADINVDSPGSAGPPTMTDSITCPDAAFPVLYFIPDPTNREPLEITNVMCDATTKQWQGTVNGVTGPLAPKYTAPFHFACSTKDTGPIESVCEGVKNLSADINVDSPGSAGPPTMTDSITCPDAAFPVLYFIPDPTNREPLEITNVMCDATTKQWQGTVNGVTGPLAPKYTAPFHFACSTKDTGPIESVCEGIKDLSADLNENTTGSAGPPTVTDSITCPDAAFPKLYIVEDQNTEPVEITNVMCDATTREWQATINGATGSLVTQYTAPFNLACA